MPKFLGIDVALAIHHDQVAVFGGRHGLRDAGLLESALGQGQQTYVYTGNLFEAAALYCVSIVRNHPFLDGNKRTGADCMLTFLLINRVEPTLTADQLFEWTLKVALGEIERPALADLLRGSSRVPAEE